MWLFTILIFMEASNVTVDSDCIVTRHSLTPQVCDRPNPLCTQWGSPKWTPICTYANQLSLDTPIVCTLSRPNMTPLYVENWVFMVWYLSCCTPPPWAIGSTWKCASEVAFPFKGGRDNFGWIGWNVDKPLQKTRNVFYRSGVHHYKNENGKMV